MEFSAAIGGVMEPEITGETSSFIIVYKPPRMHSAPLRENKDETPFPVIDGIRRDETPHDRISRDKTLRNTTLLDFAAESFPEIRSVGGWKSAEGGLVHRLDYDTRGLLLIARTQAAMDALRGQQEADGIVKEYTALSAGRDRALPGFPPAPCTPSVPGLPARDRPGVITSAFRPYGVGRKAVRPVLSQPVLPGSSAGKAESAQKIYRTEILSGTEDPDGTERFRLRLSRGYRHQIRCHLAWIGRPIVNDVLYGGVGNNAVSGGCLALCATAISFADPVTGRRVRYCLDGE
jgi:23S rRNA pseudouridine1911/1915/1917 synthase